MEPLGLNKRAFGKRGSGRRAFLLLLCGFVFRGALLFAISVEEAYQAIPHRYTPFESKQVKMGPKDAAVLLEFFRILNLAIVERVQAQAWFQSNGKRGVTFPNYQRSTDRLIVQLEALTISESLKAVQRDVIDALKQQSAYLEEWQRAVHRGEPFRYAPGTSPNHPRVLSSSQKLRQAYGRLIQLYPRETERTKQAFFDHLCALDFI